jgi:hypothetical protein
MVGSLVGLAVGCVSRRSGNKYHHYKEQNKGILKKMGEGEGWLCVCVCIWMYQLRRNFRWIRSGQLGRSSGRQLGRISGRLRKFVGVSEFVGYERARVSTCVIVY